MTRVAIVQPSYLPWKGYFDLIHEVDTFIFLDDVQHTVRDWRTRNRIKTRAGRTQWLTVPVLGGRNQRICDVHIDQASSWAHKHAEAIRHSYARTPHFGDYFPELSARLQSGPARLSDFDVALTRLVAGWLGLDRRFVLASDLAASGARDVRLIDLIHKVGGTSYLSGPSARAYIDPEKFARAGIELAFIDYSGYPEYPQVGSPFEHAVTVVDLLFAVGPEAPHYIWGARRLRAAGRG
jgi:hypothetical protein